MKKNDFYEYFKSLNIDIKTLPDNYNPEMYGKKLMSEIAETSSSVSYSVSTNYYKSNSNYYK